MIFDALHKKDRCIEPGLCIMLEVNFAFWAFSEVRSVSNRWPENQSETPSASCMGKSWHPQTDLIIVWSHCGVEGCSEGRGRTYHPPRLHAQGPRELLDRCEDRKRQKEDAMGKVITQASMSLD